MTERGEHLGITKLAEITGPNPSNIVPEYVTESIADMDCSQ